MSNKAERLLLDLAKEIAALDDRYLDPDILPNEVREWRTRARQILEWDTPRPGTLIRSVRNTDHLGVVYKSNEYTRAGEVAVQWDDVPGVYNISTELIEEVHE